MTTTEWVERYNRAFLEAGASAQADKENEIMDDLMAKATVELQRAIYRHFTSNPYEDTNQGVKVP